MPDRDSCGKPEIFPKAGFISGLEDDGIESSKHSLFECSARAGSRLNYLRSHKLTHTGEIATIKMR